MPLKRIAILLGLVLLSACSDAGPPPTDRGTDAVPPPRGRADARTPSPDATTADRPARREDTIHLEGMPQSMPLRLVRAPDGFPLRFSAYVPEDMAARFSTGDDGASLDLIAEFGGRRSPDAFLHLYVFPAGTDRREVEAMALAYRAGRELPVSMGLEPLEEAGPESRMGWSGPGYRFRYQGEGTWYIGRLGIGRHGDRFFLLMSHYPQEYVEGFGPRSDIVRQTWKWADGSPLDP